MYLQNIRIVVVHATFLCISVSKVYTVFEMHNRLARICVHTVYHICPQNSGLAPSARTLAQQVSQDHPTSDENTTKEVVAKALLDALDEISSYGRRLMAFIRKGGVECMCHLFVVYCSISRECNEGRKCTSSIDMIRSTANHYLLCNMCPRATFLMLSLELQR
jgi:hypothetical protein